MSAVKAVIPDWIYDQYSHSRLSSAAGPFVLGLPLCQAKPLYNAAIWAWHLIGDVSLPVATWTVSSMAFGLLALLLFRWPTRLLPHPVWLVLVLGISFLGHLPMASLARFSTPDALCTLLTMAALYSALARRSAGGFALFGWMAVLARPDATSIVGALTVYFSVAVDFRRPRSVFYGIGFLGLLAVTEIVVSHAAGSYGWDRTFLYTFYLVAPTDYATPLTWSVYLSTVLNNSAEFFGFARVLTLLIFSAIAFFCCILRYLPSSKTYFHLLILTWATIVCRFIVWPGLDNRYYYACFLLILLCCGEILTPYLTGCWTVLRAHRARIQHL
jgi:hypothetical protein